MKPMTDKGVERFTSKVLVSPNPDECWPWLAAKAGGGYGVVRIDGVIHKAHRLAYELCIGPIPPGMVVMHTCDNPPCCNPSHLRLGTQRDNVLDMVAKGRMYMPHPSRPNNTKE